MTDTDQIAVLEGQIAIRAALQSGSREVNAILIEQGKKDRSGDIARLTRTAQAFKVEVRRVPREEIDAQTSGQTHGGLVALVGPRRFVPLDALIPARDTPFIAMIDGVEDPFNFGQAIRALYAAGADGLVVRPRNWMSAAGIVARASAGASERIPTAVAETAEEAADFFKKRGLTIATTAKKHAASLYETDLTKPLFILIGGEKRGVTRSFLDRADTVLEIPYGRKYSESLGATAAASVLAFEIMRQRQQKR